MTEQEQYEQDAKTFREKMDAKRPLRENFAFKLDFERAEAAWLWELSCDAPNKPGHYRANND